MDRERDRETHTSANTLRDHEFDRGGSATKHIGLFLQPAQIRCLSIRVANAAGEAMARDSGTMRALVTMSPQIATE